MRNGIEGRADNIYAAVRSFVGHPSIDPGRIGLVGHSQGGWVVVQGASQHEDIAFFVSLVGPTSSVWRNVENYRWHILRCQGYNGSELDQKVTAAREVPVSG